MKIVTALANPTLNNELKKINEFEIITPDVQYQDGVIEILENKKDIDILILSEIIPGDFNIIDFIKLIISKNNKIKIIIFLENKKEELENFLISKGIFNIFYNNEITFDEIINLLKSEDNKLVENEFQSIEFKNKFYRNNNRKNNYDFSKEKNYIKKDNLENKIFKKNKIKENNLDKINNYVKYNIKKNKNIKRAYIISIVGNYEVGKSIFCVNLSKNLRHKKVLLIDFDFKNSSIHSILGIKKFPNNLDEKEDINLENLIHKVNKNFYVLCDIKLIFKKENNNLNVKDLFLKLKYKYDFIIIDTSSDFNFEETKKLIKISNKCFFLVEANILEIKKSKVILSYFLENWYIKKEKINIIFNKYNKYSIKFSLLKMIFSDFKILGKINYDSKYNLLINKNYKNYLGCNKIKKQYRSLINNLIISEINILGGDKNKIRFIRKQN